MPKIKLFAMTAILALCLLNFASADLIFPDTHPVERCVKLMNLNEYSNISLIVYIEGPTIKGFEAYKLDTNPHCLPQIYKFATLTLYWIENENLGSINFQGLTPEIISKYLHPVSGMVGHNSYYIEDSNPLKKEDIELSIAGYSEKTLVLYKSKQVSEYNDGTPAKTEVFDNPNHRLNEPPSNLGFFRSIWCFIKKIFKSYEC
ncbi:hypothetical protein HYW76_03015 [Candidatus Pacearchaeota archaeon]|nr:hypothetical protein [Candidatus Pacearchaeota archaeon]